MKNNDKLPPTQDSRCGTMAGYTAHRRRKENSCFDCLNANNSYAKEWRTKNKEKATQSNKKSRLAHPERVKRNKKSWREANPERYSEMIRNARNKNPQKYQDMYRGKARERRAKKRLNGFEPYTEQEVLEKYGSNCHICKQEIDLNAPRRSVHGTNWHFSLHIDHLIPISKGGPDTLENVRPSHAYCNLKKGAN